MPGEGAHRGLPVCPHLRLMRSVGSAQNRRAAVIEHDREMRVLGSNGGQLAELRMVQPAVEHETALFQHTDAGTHVRARQVPGVGNGAVKAWVGVPAHRGPYSTQPTVGGNFERIQYRCHALCQRQIDVTHRGSTHPGSVKRAGIRLRADTGHEHHFPYRPQRVGAVAAVHGMALGKHGGHHAVPARQVRRELRQQIRRAGTDPQVMVRVDDGQ